jgi:4-carboxymuconolactone decarboxylase
VSSQHSPRVAPLPREQWDDDVRAAISMGMPERAAERFFATGPDAMDVPSVIGTLVNHPALAGPLLALNTSLLNSPVLERRPRELMVLRVGWRTGSVYEWAQHVRLAPRFGITPEEVEAIPLGADADVWTPLERDLLKATDELIDHYRISDEIWARLAGQLDERALMEVVFTVGIYACLAMAFNSFGLQLDPGLEVTLTPPSQ